MTTAADIWTELRTHERPIVAFLEHVTATADPQAEVARIVAALTPEEAEELLPEIEREAARLAASPTRKAFANGL